MHKIYSKLHDIQIIIFYLVYLLSDPNRMTQLKMNEAPFSAYFGLDMWMVNKFYCNITLFKIKDKTCDSLYNITTKIISI